MSTPTPAPTAAAMVENALAAIKAHSGFVPNILADFAATSPTVFLGYMSLAGTIERNAQLSKVEQLAVMLYISALNKCDYCCVAHTAMAKAGRVNAEDINALKAGQVPNEPALKLVIQYAQLVWEKRGNLTDTEQAQYETQGLTKAKQMDVVALIALKTLTNYGHAITHSAVDKQFGGV